MKVEVSEEEKVRRREEMAVNAATAASSAAFSYFHSRNKGKEGENRQAAGSGDNYENNIGAGSFIQVQEEQSRPTNRNSDTQSQPVLSPPASLAFGLGRTRAGLHRASEYSKLKQSDAPYIREDKVAAQHNADLSVDAEDTFSGQVSEIATGYAPEEGALFDTIGLDPSDLMESIDDGPFGGPVSRSFSQDSVIPGASKDASGGREREQAVNDALLGELAREGRQAQPPQWSGIPLPIAPEAQPRRQDGPRRNALRPTYGEAMSGHNGPAPPAASAIDERYLPKTSSYNDNEPSIPSRLDTGGIPLPENPSLR